MTRRRARSLSRQARKPVHVELLIEALGAQGDGLARFDGTQIFVPYTLPGERLRATIETRTARGCRARLIEITEASPARSTPACRHFGECGGCALQHLDDDAYAAFKLARLTDALKQRGVHDAPIAPLIRVPMRSRRRVRLAARRTGLDVALGFRAARERTIVDLSACPIMRPAIEAGLAGLRAGLVHLLDEDAEIEIAITEAANGLDVLLFGTEAGGPERRARFADLAGSLDLARLSVRRDVRTPSEPVLMRADPIMRFAGVSVALPPDAFVQPTAEGEEAIVAALIDAARDAERVADLFCGLGALSLPLARAGAAVTAYDSAGEAIAALETSARRSALAPRLTAERRDLARAPLGSAALSRHDLAVFDPPRTGAAAQAKELAASSVPRVVAVSCNAATFARDARLLLDGGYELKQLIPLDQFLWSPHIELIATFVR
jgi:23S rRNA (uracil1939-C5)-methyltransferase